MTPARIRAATVLEKAGRIEAMLQGIRSLPLASPGDFQSDPRNAAAAESYLRRALEALLDLGRHILAKGCGRAPAEYKEVAAALARAQVLDQVRGTLMLELAGYRNRLVHFYDEISERELYDICTTQLGDIESVRDALLDWVRRHPERVEGEL